MPAFRDNARQQLIDWIEADRDKLISFLSGFLAKPSANPPGDTREATAFVADWLQAEGISCEIVAPMENMPNIVAVTEGAGPGRHLVMNGHIDVFPVSPDEKWTHVPWSGDVADGCIWGRGASDMKCGTSALILAFAYLTKLKAHWPGKLVLTAVSDEETGGKWGTRYLLEHRAEDCLGDCVLNAEPSGLNSIRFAEKGTLRLSFVVETPGAHGAYPHRSKNANRIAAGLIVDLDAINDLPVNMPPKMAEYLARPEVRACMDGVMGKGAADVATRVTLSVGVVKGGIKVNMMPGICRVEADIRLPFGVERKDVLAAIGKILERYPEVTLEVQEAASNPASASEPDHEMLGILKRVIEEISPNRPEAITGIGGTDCKFFRYMGVPAFVYGPSPETMSMPDERVPIEDFLQVLRVHALAAFDYLTAS
ncbi:MAG: M20/M25/M40 family metallo-hydrolase [Proteobacteria bacterium]|nr:M20/M25/M40 family metallo-hydrolase [Pseudomonadota bacterium]